MVKNLSTIDRSERVRIGKHVPNEQAVNTIIINASSNVIEASQEGFYLAPIRVNEAMNSNVMCYDITTNEVVDSGKALTFQGLTEAGNSTTETIQFTNDTTSFVTTSNVGIANTNPQHELSVGGDVYVEGNLTVIGETTAISSENLRIKDAIVELGENNTDGDFVFDLGLIMTRPGSNVTASYIESSNEYIIGYTQNSASDTYITPDASNLIQMRVYGDVTANSFIGDGSFLSNVIQDTDLDANLTVIRDEMAANTLTLRDDIQSNANVLRGEMAANTVTLRADLQSNITISQNTMRSEMTANTLALRDDLQSNITISQNTMRGEMAANTLALRSDLQSNVTSLLFNDEAIKNTLRGDLQSNVTILRGEMAANTVTLRSDLQSNATTLRGEMAANTVTLRNEIALKSNINNPVFTGIITGDGGAISNISLQHVTEYGNSTDQTITMSNALSLITSGSVGINTPTPQKMLHVAGEILADDDITGVDFYGDDATFTGGLTVSGNSLFYGNLEVRGNTTYLSTQNLLVEDPILALAANNASSSLDTGVVLVYQGESNVAFGYRGASNEFIISHTLSSPGDSELIPDTSNAINVHVYGDVTADGNIHSNYFIGDGSYLTGISTVSNLEGIVDNGNVSSNTIQLTNADVGLKATGNVEAARFIGDGSYLTGISTVSNLEGIVNNGNVSSNTIQLTNTGVGLKATGTVEAARFIGDGSQLTGISGGGGGSSNLEGVVTNGNVTTQTIHIQNVVSLTTTGNVGIANTNPIHNLDVGTNLWVEDTGSNVLYVNGNIHATDALSIGSNLHIEDTNSNVLVIDGNASINDTLFLSAIELDVVGSNTSSQTTQFTNANVGAVFTGGIVINDGSYKCKHYAYSNVSVPTNFANVAMTFASNVFHAKITAQLTHGNEEVSTMVLDVQGGTRDGTTSSLNIASGTGSVFGHTNTKPWSMSVGTTPTKVILEPSSAGTSAYGVDVYIEYKSSSTEGKLDSISIGADTVKSFVY